ncbi:ABC transporter permease [Beduini massiliensis]|uniref:ABC transporter permease n=1 Tax=Beduini massiliensis TaxID=1585974 RepID=UPI00059A9C2F|nr:ABC transporter permease [Beduini massiliensis]
MKNLIKCELKKFLHPLPHRIVIAFLMILPLLFVLGFQYSEQHSQVLFDGEWVSLAKGKQSADQIRTDLAGLIDESWLSRAKTMLDDVTNSDLGQMDMKYQTVSDAYWKGKYTYNNYETNKHNIMTPEIVKVDLEKHSPVYGPYEGWLTRLEIFKYCAIVYIISCLYLFSDLFNQEEAAGIMDMLKSSRMGRKPLAFAKIAVALIMTVTIGLLMYGVLALSTSSMLNLQGSKTTVLMLEGAFQIYNFKEINQQAFLLMMVGGVSCTMVAAFLSVIMKKPFASLAGSILFYAGPSLITIRFFNTAWNVFFPSSFLNFQSLNQLMHFSWVQINAQIYHRMGAVGLIWGTITCLLMISIIYVHCKNKKNYILKGWRS